MSCRINKGPHGGYIVLVLVAAAQWILHLYHPTVGFFLDPFDL